MKCLKLLVPLLILLFSSCECEEVKLQQVCPVQKQCYIGKWDANTEENIVIIDYEAEPDEFRACNFGTLKCDPETMELTCEGVTYPEQEICDGKDNNCDGIIDNEETLTILPARPGNDCLQKEKGVCKYSVKACVDGEYTCLKPPTYGEEVCDNEDNDCDGEVDEDIIGDFVYDGPPETLNVGECRAGLTQCEEGKEVVFGMRTPVEEICGNDDDDDCDGLTDEYEGERTYDFLLIVDVSGSMYNYIYTVKQTLCLWAQNQMFTQSRFAVVAIGDPNGNNNYNNFEIKKVTDFVSAAGACAMLDVYLDTFNAGGWELQLNAILQSFEDEGQGDYIDLSWSEERKRKVVIFSDEEVQYVDPVTLEGSVNLGLDRVLESCEEHDYTVNAFIAWDPYMQYKWHQLTSGCHGYLDYLDANPTRMVEQLNYWFGEECGVF